MRSTDHNGAIREERYGTAVNDSPTGMRLLLGVVPTKGQVLEIQTDDRTLDHPVCLVEVCWTKPLQEDTQRRCTSSAVARAQAARTMRLSKRDPHSAWDPPVNGFLPISP